MYTALDFPVSATPDVCLTSSCSLNWLILIASAVELILDLGYTEEIGLIVLHYQHSMTRYAIIMQMTISYEGPLMATIYYIGSFNQSPR